MISKTVKANLLAIVAAYRKATGATVPEVSKKFYGNTNFLDEFRDGEHSISLKKLDGMVAKFREEWPEGAEWPYLRPAFMDR